jgi:hypothetical protein
MSRFERHEVLAPFSKSSARRPRPPGGSQKSTASGGKYRMGPHSQSFFCGSA